MLWCWAVFVLAATTQALSTSLRLSEGPGPYAGRVEVKYNGTWRSVCDDGFDFSTGHVICSELGYSEVVAVPCCSAFGTGKNSTFFWLDDVVCHGNESKLTECNHKKWGEHDCNRYDHASVVCKAPNTSISRAMPLRLSYAPVPYAGCVEVKYAGVWGDIASYRWDRANNQVVCKQLGYRDVVSVIWNCRAILKKSYTVVTWMDNVRCHGDESSLTNCSHDFQTSRSSLGQDVGVVCKNETEPGLNISLNGSSVTYAGRVEVHLAGKSGAIDRYTWELPDAHVACRQLGFPAAELAIRGATYIFNPIRTWAAMEIQWLENVGCLGNESRLHECPHEVSFTPGPVFEAGVVCKSDNLERRIRLAGGNDSFAGRLEVYIAGVWGTVRNSGWKITSSNVACRQLGYQGVNSIVVSSVERFGKGHGPVWMSGVECKGHEESLWECPWSKIAGIYWDHDNDIGLVCKNSNEDHGPEKVSKWRRILIIALTIVAAVIFVPLMIFLLYRFCYKKREGYDIGGDSIYMSEVSSSTDIGLFNPGFKENETTSEKKSKEELDWCEIPRERISLGEKIGAEPKAVIFHARLSLENGNIADCIVKTSRDLPAEKIVSSLEDDNDLLIELKIMSCLGSHLNILNMFGACTIKGPTYLVFEDVDYGSLLDYLKQNQMKHGDSTQTECSLSNEQKLKIALDIARGMKHIAEKKCIHKDLAARNILVSTNLAAKVTNIGCSRGNSDESLDDNISAGSLSRSKWMAPETLETLNFTSQSDTWSFGILLWEIETGGAIPHSGIPVKDLLQTLKSGYRLTRPAKCSDAVYDVMTKCWQTVPSERPVFSELCIVLDTLVSRQTSYQEDGFAVMEE